MGTVRNHGLHALLLSGLFMTFAASDGELESRTA